MLRKAILYGVLTAGMESQNDPKRHCSADAAEDKGGIAMFMLTLNYVPGANIQALGLCKGNVVQSKHLGKDFMAGMKNLVGGEIESYTEMLVEAREIATKRMLDNAAAMGADGVIDVKYSSAAIMQGAAEIVAYGTAVKIVK
jgi:uncharacterized protein YbjQ (UPF0145 family)